MEMPPAVNGFFYESRGMQYEMIGLDDHFLFIRYQPVAAGKSVIHCIWQES